MTQPSDQVTGDRAKRAAGERLAQLLEELTVFEAFVSTRVAAIRAEIEALGEAIGVSLEAAPTVARPLDLPFRKPSVLDVLPVPPYQDFFPGWQLGSGDPRVKCTVQQVPAPDSALTYPSHRMIVRLRREGSTDISFLSLELDLGRPLPQRLGHCDTAVRLRSKARAVVKPSLRLFFASGSWHDLWGAPYEVGAEFRSHSTTFDLPEKLGPESEAPAGGRLIYYLPSDAELELDIAYVTQGFRA